MWALEGERGDKEKVKEKETWFGWGELSIDSQYFQFHPLLTVWQIYSKSKFLSLTSLKWSFLPMSDLLCHLMLLIAALFPSEKS